MRGSQVTKLVIFLRYTKQCRWTKINEVVEHVDGDGRQPFNMFDCLMTVKHNCRRDNVFRYSLRKGGVEIPNTDIQYSYEDTSDIEVKAMPGTKAKRREEAREEDDRKWQDRRRDDDYDRKDKNWRRSGREYDHYDRRGGYKTVRR